MTNLIENDIYETGDSFCDITIKLYDQIRIQRRTYKKLIEIMAYFGGFMDMIYFIIDLILIFHINPLYEIDIVNKLFKFDLENKLIYIKRFPKSKIPIDFLVLNNNCMNNNKKFENNNNYNNNDNAENIKNIDNNDLNSTNIIKDNKIHNDVNDFCTNDRDIYSEKYYDQERNRKKIIDNIKLNLISNFCCFHSRKNKNIFLLKRGMDIFIEKMDILNIFKKSLINETKLDEEFVIGILT